MFLQTLLLQLFQKILQLEPLVELHQHVYHTKQLKHLRLVMDRITDEYNILDPLLNQKQIQTPSSAKVHEAA